MKCSIEFELKNFNRIFNQNKEIKGIQSAKYKYGGLWWSVRGAVTKHNNQKAEELSFYIYLDLFADVFPLLVYVKFFILNKDKDSRKDLKKCNL